MCLTRVELVNHCSKGEARPWLMTRSRSRRVRLDAVHLDNDGACDKILTQQAHPAAVLRPRPALNPPTAAAPAIVPNKIRASSDVTSTPNGWTGKLPRAP
jgi:hypothetical protein